MKLLFTSASVLLGLTVVLMPSISCAQSAGDFGNSGDNRDPFNRASTGDTSGLMQLLNQAQMNGRNNPNYSKDQQEQLNSATADFRARQMQAIKERNKKTVPATVVRPK